MISGVVEEGLCVGCGLCYTICPKDAISILVDSDKGIYRSKVDESLCISCNKCLNACPGRSADFRLLNKNIFHKEYDDSPIGSYSRCFAGYSLDNDIRNNSASGGVVTQLLVKAIEAGIITGALVTRMSKDDPLLPEPFIARTREEIIEAAGSKYCPVPLGIAIKELENNKDKGVIAVVGLPCHIHGFRKAELNKSLHYNLIYFGIFCGHSPNFTATKYLLQENKINISNIEKLDYRGSGWPGGMTIKTKDDNTKFIKYGKYWNTGFGQYFFPYRCTLCYDGLAEFADISFGDAWLPEYSTDKIGTSMIVSRTEIGDKFLDACGGALSLTNIPGDKVIESQSRMLDYKKKKYHSRKSFCQLLKKPVPEYNESRLKPSIIQVFDGAHVYFSLWIAKRRLWPLLKVDRILTMISNAIIIRIKNRS